MGADPQEFFNKITDLLTCQALEVKISKLCGSTPIYQAVTQFDGNLDLCKSAMTKVTELTHLFASYFGAGADCNSMLDSWKFNGYKDKYTCQMTIRKEDFSKDCRLA